VGERKAAKKPNGPRKQTNGGGPKRESVVEKKGRRRKKGRNETDGTPLGEVCLNNKEKNRPFAAKRIISLGGKLNL